MLLVADKADTSAPSAEREADEAVLSIALSTKLLAKDLATKLSLLRKQPKILDDDGNELIDLSILTEASKLLLALSDASVKVGRRAEEITAKKRRELESLSEPELLKLAEQTRLKRDFDNSPPGSIIKRPLTEGFMLVAEKRREEEN